jgi:hypothetical protein
MQINGLKWERDPLRRAAIMDPDCPISFLISADDVVYAVHHQRAMRRLMKRASMGSRRFGIRPQL